MLDGFILGLNENTDMLLEQAKQYINLDSLESMVPVDQGYTDTLRLVAGIFYTDTEITFKDY